MTSSSAYNNVLLKTAVQAQPATVPKRDYQNDSAASDFQQALQDVRDSSSRQSDLRDKDIRAQDARAQNALTDARAASRRQDEKLAQVNNDKAAASADNRKPANDTSKQNESVNDADQSAQNSGDEKVCAKDKTTSTKSTDSKKTKKAEDTTEDAAAATTTTTAAPGDTELPSALTVATASEKPDEKDLTTEKDLTAENADSVSAKNKNADGTDALLTAQATAGESNSDTTQASTDSALQQTITQQTAADAASQQAAQASVSQTAAQNPALPNAANSVTENVPADTAADVLASLAIDSLNTEKSSGKTTATNTSSTADAESGTTSTPAQEVDAKSSFEKMLQSVARSGVSAKDESAPANTSNNANNTSSTNSNATDSLFHQSDTQTPATRSFVVQTAVPIPVGQPQWSQAVGERVLWLAAQNVSSAEINLHPKDLGPIQVKVSVNQEQATVSFTSHHAVVREVLDQNLNRLRDMFNEQGLNLVNVDVSDKSFSRQQGESKDQKGQGGANSLVEDETPVAVSAIVQQRLVDHYA